MQLSTTTLMIWMLPVLFEMLQVQCQQIVPEPVLSTVEVAKLKRLRVAALHQAQGLRHELSLDSLRLESLDGRKFPVKKLIENGPRLVLRFSEYQCELCITEFLRLLKQGENASLLPRLTLVGAWDRLRSAQFLARRLNLDADIYRLNANDSRWPAKATELPYVFVLDSSLSMRYVFVPLKEIPATTMGYLKYLVHHEMWTAAVSIRGPDGKMVRNKPVSSDRCGPARKLKI